MATFSKKRNSDLIFSDVDSEDDLEVPVREHSESIIVSESNKSVLVAEANPHTESEEKIDEESGEVSFSVSTTAMTLKGRNSTLDVPQKLPSLPATPTRPGLIRQHGVVSSDEENPALVPRISCESSVSSRSDSLCSVDIHPELIHSAMKNRVSHPCVNRQAVAALSKMSPKEKCLRKAGLRCGWYKVVGKGCAARSARVRKSKLVGRLCRHTRVRVVEIHGDRMRIDSPILGWVSFQAKSGNQLLKFDREATDRVVIHRKTCEHKVVTEKKERPLSKVELKRIPRRAMRQKQKMVKVDRKPAKGEPLKVDPARDAMRAFLQQAGKDTLKDCIEKMLQKRPSLGQEILCSVQMVGVMNDI